MGLFSRTPKPTSNHDPAPPVRPGWHSYDPAEAQRHHDTANLRGQYAAQPGEFDHVPSPRRGVQKAGDPGGFLPKAGPKGFPFGKSRRS